jgi:hypothetical protein
VVVGGLSLAGVLAVTTDTARTGEARYSTGQFEEPAAVDLQLAEASGPALEDCGPWAEDLTTPLVSFSDEAVITGLEVPVCFRNNSAEPVVVSVTTEDLVDDELACTGAEGDAGVDDTCGPDASDPDTSRGELSDVLVVGIRTCPTPGVEVGPPFQLGTLASITETPYEIGAVGAGEAFVFCLSLGAAGASDGDRRVAQTDEVRWRFAFVGEPGDGTVVVGEPSA